MAKAWRDDIDYSKELQRTDLSAAERAQLETERQNKINDKYGGVEPTMTGSSEKFSDIYKSGSSSGSSSSSSQESSGIYGLNVIDKAENQNGWAIGNMPDTSRRTDLAGQIAVSGGYTNFYDDNGYLVKSIKGVADYTPSKDYYVSNGSYSGGNLWTDEEMLTAEDLAKIAGIRAGIGTQYTADQANQLANQIRSGYGYTIDKSGNVTDLLGKSRVEAFRDRLGLTNEPASQEQANFLALLGQEQKNGGISSDLLQQLLTGSGSGASGGSSYNSGSYGGSSAPEYSGSKWDPILEELAQQLVKMNYADWTQGEQYQALADRYGQNGRMSMQDVLGQIASRTGGLASSYATSAAQQQYNDYMSKLEEVAREMYSDERSDLLDQAQLARQYSQDDYNKYLDELGQWNTDRNFDYNAYRDSVEDQRYADEWAYTQDQQEKADLAERAQLLAAFGDFSGYKALGYSDAEIATMQAVYQAQNTKKNQSSPGSSSDSGNSITQDYDGLFTAARASGHAKSFIANNYKSYGFTSSSGLYNDYEDWNANAVGNMGAVAQNLYGQYTETPDSSLNDLRLNDLYSAYEAGQINDRELGVLLDILGIK